MKPGIDARELTVRLDGSWHNGKGTACCPVPNHGRGRGDKNPSLSIGTGERGKVLVHCFAGCSQRDVLAELTSRGLWGPSRTQDTVLRFPKPAPSPASESVWRTAWSESSPLSGTIAERYLVGVRKVVGPGTVDSISANDLRFHPAAPFNEAGTWRVPGLLANIRDRSGTPVGVQVTGLKPDGSGKIEHVKPRHNFGRVGGGAVRLTAIAIGGSLAIAEGLETALGLTKLSGHPCWAALGANLKTFEPPTNVSELIIAADNDPPGHHAAIALAQRVEDSCPVMIRHPAKPGADWADVAAESTDHG